VAAPSGVTFPVEGTIKGYHVLAARGSHGENPVLCGCATTAPLASYPSWRWWWLAGGVALCIANVVVRLVRVGRKVRRTHGGVASVGALGAVVILVMAEQRCYFLNSLRYTSH
jgi:hypothetical protein